jgi:hypothetical protein
VTTSTESSDVRAGPMPPLWRRTTTTRIPFLARPGCMDPVAGVATMAA